MCNERKGKWSITSTQKRYFIPFQDSHGCSYFASNIDQIVFQGHHDCSSNDFLCSCCKNFI